MDAAMRRIAKADQRTKGVDSTDKKQIDWRKEIRDIEADRNEYVMLIAEGDPDKFLTFMRSPVSLFLTALDAYTKKIERQDPKKNNAAVVDPKRVKKG